MKIKTYCLPISLLGLVITSCISSPHFMDCPRRPMTKKEDAFMRKYDKDPFLEHSVISRIEYEYRDGYEKKNGCIRANTSGEYSYLFRNHPIDDFVDTATIRAIALDRLTELYTNVIEDSVLYATKSFDIWLDNEEHMDNAEESETYYEMWATKEAVANFVGYKVVKKGNRLVHETVPKQPMKFEKERFDPLIKRLPSDK